MTKWKIHILNVRHNYSESNSKKYFKIINALFFFYMTRQAIPQDASIVNK